jgi:parallel beta-helix repeat protein
VLAALGLGATSARADPQGQVGSPGDPVERLYAQDVFVSGTVGTAANPAPVTGSLAATGRPWHDVTAYGAAGDGTTDDLGAINDARDAARSSGGGVFFPAGDYLVSAYVDFDGVPVVGTNPFDATVLADPSVSRRNFVGGASNNDEWVVGSYGADGWACLSLGVDVQGQDAAGIAAFNGSNNLLAHNYVRDSDDCGIQFYGNNGSGTAPVTDSVMANNVVEGSRWNLVADGQVEDCVVAGNTSRDPIVSGVSIHASEAYDTAEIRGLVVSGNVLSGGPRGVRTVGGEVFMNVVGNYLRNTSVYGIYLVGSNGIVSNNTVHARTSQAAIRVATDTQALISDNFGMQPSTGVRLEGSPDPSAVVDNVWQAGSTAVETGSVDTTDWVVRGNETLP